MPPSLTSSSIVAGVVYSIAEAPASVPKNQPRPAARDLVTLARH